MTHQSTSTQPRHARPDPLATIRTPRFWLAPIVVTLLVFSALAALYLAGILNPTPNLRHFPVAVVNADAGPSGKQVVKRGDVIAFLDKNHPACLESTFAAASLGAANAIINFRLAADEMDYVFNDSGAKVLIVGADLKAAIDKIRDKLPNVEQVVVVTPEGGDGDEYEAMLASATPVDRSSDVDPDDDVCIIMYSSGTTGRPKGVALTQANLIAHTVNGQEGFEFDDGDKNMVAMPEVVKELPRNPTGKLLKKDLRKPHWEDAGRKV